MERRFSIERRQRSRECAAFQRRRRERAAVVGLVTLSWISTVRAQAPDAEALTSQGIELRRDHKNAEALELFRKAFALAPGPRIQAHLGLAEQAAGQWVEAERDIRASLEAKADPWIAKNRTALEQALGIVVDHLGWIEVQTAADKPEVWINGSQVPAYTPGDSIRVVAGTNIVEVRAAHHLPTMRTVLVLPNTRMRETFALSRHPSAPSAEAIAAPTSEIRAREASPPTVPEAPGEKVVHDPPQGVPALVYGALGVGAAGLLTGAGTGALSLAYASKAMDACDGNKCQPSAQGDIDTSLRLAHVSNGAFIVGGAGVAVGVVAWVLHSRRSAPPAAQPRVRSGVSNMDLVLGDRWLGVAGRF